MPNGSAPIPPNCCVRPRAPGSTPAASRDAGSYLCNYLSWRAIEAVGGDNGPRLAAFVHIPPLARGGAVRRKGFSRITLEELVDAGEAMLHGNGAG